jgi:hypothetical protein
MQTWEDTYTTNAQNTTIQHHKDTNCASPLTTDLGDLIVKAETTVLSFLVDSTSLIPRHQSKIHVPFSVEVQPSVLNVTLLIPPTCV